MTRHVSTDIEQDDQSVYDFVFIGIFSLLRLPVVVLTLLIVFHRSATDGPSGGSKLALVLGTILNSVLAVPPSWWANLSVNVDCVGMFSVVDIVQLLHILSLFFYFAFLRTEYKRNMEVRATPLPRPRTPHTHAPADRSASGRR